MADYRFSAQVISRGKGQSSVASAAYRAASRLVDERTGEIHDYGRKGGVLHSEVMAPEATPEWMTDRTQLWNAVEAVERRKDAQLAREVQLSLPHELTGAQREELVRGFVQEHFVDRGMIADVAIHAPGKEGDQRNHHAHIMLTMRELTGDGFGKKNRDWNSPEQLSHWREEWAQHQNRTLEKAGLDVRVDHRSYADQGVDREATKHLGPIAADMERNGKPSRIGDENRDIANDNRELVNLHVERAQNAEKIAKAFKEQELENAHDLANLDLSQKHQRQKNRLEATLDKRNGEAKKVLQAEINTIDRKLQAKGVRKILRNLFGQAKSDRETMNQLKATLSGIEKREGEERQGLEFRQAQERKSEARKQQKNRDRIKDKQSHEIDHWGRGKSARGSVRQSQRQGRPNKARTEAKAPNSSPTPTKTTSRPSQAKDMPKAESFDKPSMADVKRNPANRKLEERGSMKRPWENSTKSANDRPWESNLTRGSRGRSPSPGGGKGGKS